MIDKQSKAVQWQRVHNRLRVGVNDYERVGTSLLEGDPSAPRIFLWTTFLSGNQRGNMQTGAMWLWNPKLWESSIISTLAFDAGTVLVVCRVSGVGGRGWTFPLPALAWNFIKFIDMKIRGKAHES